MRILLLIFSLILGIIGIAPAKGQAARDWSNTVTLLPSGGYAVGNPAAKAQLVEWVSYTCPHCGAFTLASKAELMTLVKSGKVRVEYRTMPRDALDLAAGVLSRCGGTARFVGAHNAIFANQKAMLDKAEAFAATPAAQQPVPTLGARLTQVADAAGLSALMRGRGLTAVQINRCLTDEAGAKRVIAIAEAAQTAGITGTPSFEIGGRRVEAHDWAELKPQLLAAL